MTDEATDVVAVPSVNQDGESRQLSSKFEVHDEDAAVEATTKALQGIHGHDGAQERAEALVRGRHVEPETAVEVAPKRETATPKRPAGKPRTPRQPKPKQ